MASVITSSAVCSASSWSVADVSAWLYQQDLDKCTVDHLSEVFERHAIDGKALLATNAKDLEHLGVKFGPRKKVCKRITALKDALKETSPTKASHGYNHRRCHSDNSTDSTELGSEVPDSPLSRPSSPDFGPSCDWLPAGERLWRLEYTRCPNEFREGLMKCPDLPTGVELASGAMVFVQPQALDYVERLVDLGHESVANLCGKDVICSCTFKPQIESVVARIPRSKTKQKAEDLIAMDITVSPSAAVPRLTKETLGRDVEFVQNTFLCVRRHASICAQSVASSTDGTLGKRKNPRRRLEECRALGVLSQ